VYQTGKRDRSKTACLSFLEYPTVAFWIAMSPDAKPSPCKWAEQAHACALQALPANELQAVIWTAPRPAAPAIDSRIFSGGTQR
jgi:hypothetical protein